MKPFQPGRKSLSSKLVFRKKEYQLEDNSIKVKLALKQLNLSLEAHLLVRNGSLINENDGLKDGVVAVITGGSVNT